ncbi:MAG: SDR family oxidoreductase [Chloroflexota bacterium]
MTNAPHLFCFGYGYTAQTLGQRLLKEGWRVSGTTTSEDKATALKETDVQMTIWRAEDVLPQDALNGVTHLLQSIVPDDTGDPVLGDLHTHLAHTDTLEWVGYLSTTGVYGNQDGAWVDESTPVAPSNQRGKRRVLAEEQWLKWGQETRVATHIFRLSGIYGAYRNALSKVRAGTARRIQIDNHYFSRIHVEDIATVLQASIASPHAGSIYNLADDMPSPAADVTTYACELLDVTPPPLQTPEEVQLSPMAMSFYNNSKRVRNDKIKNDLGVSLQFPDYKVGLRQLYEDGAY